MAPRRSVRGQETGRWERLFAHVLIVAECAVARLLALSRSLHQRYDRSSRGLGTGDTCAIIDRDHHDLIVRRLYAAAAGEIGWSDVLSEMAGRFGQSAGVLVIADPATNTFRAEAHGRSSGFANDYYASDLFRNDPRTPYFLSVRPGTVYYDHCLYDVDAMRRDSRVRDSEQAIGVSYQLAATLRLPHNQTGIFALLSTAREGHASEAAIAAFHRLAPHIEQAVALGEVVARGKATEGALMAAVAAHADGVMLLDRTATVRFANEGARAALAAGDGLAWTDAGFVTCRGPETRRLARLIDAAITAGASPALSRPGGEMLVTRPSGLLPYVVRVMPAQQSDILASMSTACVLHLHDLAAVRSPSRELMAAVFGLTEREADLGVELVRCASLAGAARRAGMAHNTARNHLHSLFAKCGVASQAEAVRLLGNLPPA
jgi:DNA-binding CsgD family transcriptional regulator